MGGGGLKLAAAPIYIRPPPASPRLTVSIPGAFHMKEAQGLSPPTRTASFEPAAGSIRDRNYIHYSRVHWRVALMRASRRDNILGSVYPCTGPASGCRGPSIDVGCREGNWAVQSVRHRGDDGDKTRNLEALLAWMDKSI